MGKYRSTIAFVVVLITLGLAPAAKAAPITVTWGSAGFTGISNAFNSSHFDAGSFAFSGFYADSLTGVSGPGYFHTHGLTTSFSMDLEIDGSWINIFSTTPSTATLTTSSLTSLPVGFTGGIVSGIRLVSNAAVGQAFHDMFGTKFTFNTTISPVPLPAAMPLFGTGLAALGFMGWRRKRRRTVI